MSGDKVGVVTGHTRRREQGSAGIYMLLSLAVAFGVGYIVYRVIRQARLDSAASASVSSSPVHGVQASRPDVATSEAPTVDTEPPAPAPEPTAVAPALPEEVEQALAAAEEAASWAEDPLQFVTSETDDVGFGRPGVSGAIDAATVDLAVRRYKARYTRCLRKAREAGVAVIGIMRIELVIDPDGKVSAIRDRAMQVPPATVDCMFETLRKIRFAKPRDEQRATVVFPIALTTATPD